MSRKWRNILIGVLVVAAVVVLFLLLPKGPDDFHDKYDSMYDAYLKAHASDPNGKGEIAVDVSSFTFSQELEDELKEEEARRAAEAAKKAEQEAEAEAEAEELAEAVEDGFAEEETPPAEDTSSENTEDAGDANAETGEGEGQEDGSEAQEDEPAAPTAEDLKKAAQEALDEDPTYPNKLEMTWHVDVPKAGMYSIYMEYEMTDAESAIRVIQINGEQPFDEAGELFMRCDTPVEQQPEEEALTAEASADSETTEAETADAETAEEGADTAEATAEETASAVVATKTGVVTSGKGYLRDDLGYHTSPYMFYFHEGDNTLTLRIQDEKVRMTVRSIKLTAPITDVAVKEDELLSYDAYIAGHADLPAVTEEVSVNLEAFESDPGAKAQASAASDGIETPEGSLVSWQVDVPQSGLYNIRIDYLTTKSRGIDIEREIRISNEQGQEPEVPFDGASTLTFSRIWTDEGEIKKDNRGNHIRPSQVEADPQVQTVYFRDSLGYQTEPYAFYFKEGVNTISLRAVNEPMVICGLTLTPIVSYPTYQEYLAAQPKAEMSSTGKDYSETVQGESSKLRSSPSLYARYDRSSSQTDPYDVEHTILNYIGGDPWTHPGEWIEWSFSVPEDGYYNISVKARQMYQRGALSARTVYIDGEIPFKEMEAVTFSYNTTWEMKTLGDDDGNPYQFYLTQGEHKIRMEVTMGKMGSVLKEVKESISRLNGIYREVLVLTGANPDRFRDYNIAKVYPDAIRRMDRESKRLYKIVDDVVAITGQKSDRAAVAQTLAIQLETFVENNERITESFTNFKDNITSLGTAMQNMSESKLDVDLIMITGSSADVPKVSENFFQSAGHEIRSCISSFFVDYNSLGNSYGDSDDVLEVWITTGRDQSTVLKTMVDDTFTRDYGINVNVKLVQADAILTAVVAGNGPDVVLSVSGWFAVNYAMRNAVEDLTQFPDYEKVVEPFYQSVLDPLTYDNGTNVGVYGLPETQNFNLLFYRTDLLKQLGYDKPPETWDELIAMLPTIQGNNMTVAVPFPDIALADISVLNSMIYQRGGRIYDDDKKHTEIDSEAGVAAFKTYTSLYNDYGLPVVYDFVSRFRSGEMPLGIASYATYNTLSVSAPEIRGLWDFTLFPGTRQEDGTVDHTVHTDGLCCLMVATDDETVKQNAWKFMSWWVSADTQVRFGREMESILGDSARYQTANKDALPQLAWSSDQLEILQAQMAQTRGFPEIAGGYSTTRHITNAIRRVINTKEDPRETLLNYARTINEEIRIKRKEFDLPLD